MLLNLGGPESLPEVEPFLVRLFSDREIIELPLGRPAQPLFARLIAKLRGPAVRPTTRGSGAARPATAHARAGAGRSRQRAEPRGPEPAFRVRLALRYWRPSSKRRWPPPGGRHLARRDPHLYPHYSQATTGSSQNELERVLALPALAGARSTSPHSIATPTTRSTSRPWPTPCGAAFGPSGGVRARGCPPLQRARRCRRSSSTAAIPTSTRSRRRAAASSRASERPRPSASSATSRAPGP